ncbi:hypothetical protein J8F10_19790 [Gemmata sp. G18]|uniref:Uncharacterized protein n=1 Tax=Gemmata palustris TaxID=2822762 RepID=A0ABS5BUV8_9BACT|nr:hypothetical protein [Gemmata palustris]MBP3957496.1 hypothetical protein [Gemmata palustris]
MPITFDCACGKVLRVADEHAGRRVKCPVCDAVCTAPEAEPQFEIVEDPAEPPAPAPKARPVARPVASRIEDDEDDRRGYSVAKSRRDEDDEEEERPQKKRKKFKRGSSNRPPQHDNFRIERRVATGGVAGGLLAMLIAVVWFIAGLMNDWIFFYPPILFILGLVAFIKGLAGEE